MAEPKSEANQERGPRPGQSAPGQRRGFGDKDARGDARGGRDGPRRGGDRKGGDRRGGYKDEKEWQPLTKLGRLVKDKKITKLEEIYLHALAIKEPEIIDFFFGTELKEETMKIKPVQKQTRAGQRTRFQAYVCVGDGNGHIGLGMKVAKEAQMAIKGATQAAKLSVIPVRRGYWGNKIGNPHTVAMKVTGKCGSVRVRLVPAPRGTGIVAPPHSKKVISMAGVQDVYTSTTGATKTRGNFLSAAYDALSKTYGYLTPDLWGPTHFVQSPYERHSAFLAEHSAKA